MADSVAVNKKSSGIGNWAKNNTMVLALLAVTVLFEILIRIILRPEGVNFFSLQNKSLFIPMNVANIIAQNSYVVILAAGMLLCILTGGNIDLSVGSIVCLVGAIAAKLIVPNADTGWQGMNIYLAIVICLFIGTLIGAWHAFWIAYVHIPPFICTLSGMLLWRGVALVVLDGMTISPMPQNYLNLFQSFIQVTDKKQVTETVFDFELDKEVENIVEIAETNLSKTMLLTIGIALAICAVTIIVQVLGRISKKRKGYQVPGTLGFVIKQVIVSLVILAISFLLGCYKGYPVILILLAVVILCYNYYTQNTVPGRYLYAIGGNAKAAKLSGVKTDNVMFFAYTNMGFLSAVAALVCVARFNSAAPTAGQSYEMDAIGSCFIGGASAYGGTGTIGGAVIGAIFMGILNNGMSILGIDSNWQQVVKGLVLLLAVIFDVVSKQRKSK